MLRYDNIDEGRSLYYGTIDSKGGYPLPVLPSESLGEESRRVRGGGIRVEAKERKDRLGSRRGSLYL